MRKSLILIGLISLFFVGFGVPSQINAQTTYELLLDNYKQSFDEYKDARDKYLAARAEFIKFQTLVSKTIAVEATQKFLDARQKVLINYLKMIKERLEQSTELTEEELQPPILYINSEIDYLERQIPFFDSADDLKDLVDIAGNTESRYSSFVTRGYKMQSLVIASKVRSLRKTADELAGLVGEQVARLRKEDLIDTVKIDRWLLEAPERILLSKTKENSGLANFNSKISNRDSSREKASKFGTLQNDLRASNQYLKEAKDFLLEIIQDIRFD